MAKTPPSENAQQLIMEVFVAGADRGFRLMDTFASWVVGGTAAAVGIMLANSDKISQFIPSDTLAIVIKRVAIAFGLVIVAKLLGSLISTKAGAIEAIREITREWSSRDIDFPDPEDLDQARREAQPWLLRLREHLTKGRSANKLRIARQTMNQLMLAGMLSLSAVILIGTAWIEIAVAL